MFEAIHDTRGPMEEPYSAQGTESKDPREKRARKGFLRGTVV